VTLSSDPIHAPHTQTGEQEINNLYLLREKLAHITKAARSATVANILAPLLCIPMFHSEVKPEALMLWLSYMFIVVVIRTWIVFRLPHEADQIHTPQRDDQLITFAVGIVGIGWGLGWILLAPDLEMVNRMIYVYMTTAAMISSMFAYSVNSKTFYAFTLPIMVPSLITVVWGDNIFPWPFIIGLFSLYIVVISISRNFARIFENTVRLRFRNEKLYQALANERDLSISANLAKSKFIAIASHDLRQPMHAVNVYLDLIDHEKLPSLEKQSLSKIKISIRTLNAMFDALLNISKLDAHVLRVNENTFSLIELIDTIRDVTESSAQKKGLSYAIEGSNLNIRGDKLLLQQLIVNLVSNAIQYTEKGSVTLTFSVVDNRLVVQIKDTGCGIAESELQQIFSEFYRVDRTRSLHDGLGLGLSIVKRLCDLLGAEISVDSTLNEGSIFTVKTHYPAINATSQIEHSKISIELPNKSRTLQGKYIAIVEDDPIIIDAYRQTLSAKGAFVHILSERDQELNRQIEAIDHIDCILSDYRLTHTTGDLLIQKIRENYNEEIPAVIVTADTSPTHIALFQKLNVPVLHKPISFQQVAQAIEKMITSHH
jgi:signal transduction histidine kinase/CheY-like chemotaxis protein